MASSVPLSYKQFRALAEKGALVRWFSSGIVERLSWVDGRPVATNPVTGDMHTIFTMKKHGSTIVRENWYCEEMPDDTPISMGDLAEAMVNGRLVVKIEGSQGKD